MNKTGVLAKFSKQFSLAACANVCGALLITLISIFVLVQLHSYLSFTLPDARIDITKSYFSDKYTSTPPPETDYGNEISLDTQSKKSDEFANKNYSFAGWYTALLTFEVAPNRLWAIYAPEIASGVEIYVNGDTIGSISDGMSHAGATGKYQKAYLTIPNGSLTSGVNEIQFFTQHFSPTTPAIRPFHLGPHSALSPIYKRDYFLSQTLAKSSTGFLLFAAIAFSLVWLFSGLEPLYGWFCGACYFLLCLVGIPLLPAHLVESERYTTVLCDFALIGFSLCMLFFSQHYSGHYSRKTEVIFQLLTGISILVTLLLLKMDISSYAQVPTHIIAIAALTLTGVYFCSNSASGLPLKGYILLFPLSTFCLLLLREASSVNNQALGPVQFVSATLLVSMICLILIRDFVLTKQELIASNNSLRLRLNDVHGELSDSTNKIKSLSATLALVVERSKMRVTMQANIEHKINSIIALAEAKSTNKNTLDKALDTALNDIRLMSDALQLDSDTLDKTKHSGSREA